MPDGQVLEFVRVTKRFGDVAAVSDFSARVSPGVVTGFLGPNGAGKTTTLRMLMGAVRPTSGTATIGGATYAELKHPARVIGAMPEDPGFRPRRTVERHLQAAAKANAISSSRVDEVIRFVGLGNEVETRIAALSLGVRQRLSAATALLGDPGALVLDEPANGLDPEGIRWMRMLMRGLADEGRTVLVSSHVLSEVEQIADDILIIAKGRQKFAGSMERLADPSAGPVVVDALDRDALSEALTASGLEYDLLRSGLTVRGSDAVTIGGIAANAGIALTTLQQRGPTLEDVFLDLVHDRPVRFNTVPAEAASASAQPVAAAPAPVPAAEQSTDAAGEATDIDDVPAPVESPAPSAEETAAAEQSLADADIPADDAFDPAPVPVRAVDADATRALPIVTPVGADAAPDPWAPVGAVRVADTGADADADADADETAGDASAERDAPAEGDEPAGVDELQDEPQEERRLPGLEGLAAAAAGFPGVADPGPAWMLRRDVREQAEQAAAAAEGQAAPAEAAPQSEHADVEASADEPQADEDQADDGTEQAGVFTPVELASPETTENFLVSLADRVADTGAVDSDAVRAADDSVHDEDGVVAPEDPSDDTGTQQ